MVWDRGRYEPEGSASAARQLERGKIDVVLHGEKLRGGFTLIRTGRGSAERASRTRWLLVKHRDEYAEEWWDIESPQLDRSVLTGRTLKEIEMGRPPGRRHDGDQPYWRTNHRTEKSRPSAPAPSLPCAPIVPAPACG